MEIPPDSFHFLSFLSVHRPEVKVGIFPAQYNDFHWGWSTAGSKAGTMLFFPTLTFFWGVQGGVIFTRFAKMKYPLKYGKKFPYSLNLLLALDKEIQVPVIEKMPFPSPFISCSISILHIFPSSISIILSLLYMNTSWPLIYFTLHHHSQAEKK